jgi:hypothetical protein
MPLYLKYEDKHQNLPGMTLFSDSRLGEWSKQTGIYVSPGVDFDTGVVNVVLWLHGFFVHGTEGLFFKDRSKLREQVLAAGKSVVLVAPWLGHGQQGASAAFYAGVGDLKGSWGESYLNQVLNALRPNPAKYARSNLTLAGLTQLADTRPLLRLGKLVIACHSGGGAGMRNLVGALGRYRNNLAECWGFDCLYGQGGAIDDASFWYNWAIGGNGRPLHIYYGSSTVPQSVKLDLMGQGLATAQGALRDPEGPNVQRVNVTLGIPAGRPIYDLMGVDDLLDMPAPRRSRASKTNFVAMAANNLIKNAHWPADPMEMHYGIAREGLRERLKISPFL